MKAMTMADFAALSAMVPDPPLETRCVMPLEKYRALMQEIESFVAERSAMLGRKRRSLQKRRSRK